MVEVAGQQRGLKVLAGPRDWAWQAFRKSIPLTGRCDCLWVAAEAPDGFVRVAPLPIAHWVGRECGLLVVDAIDGMHPDVLAAASGTLRAGGDLLLLLPDWAQWPAYGSGPVRLQAQGWLQAQVGIRFLQRIRQALCADWVKVQSPGLPSQPLHIAPENTQGLVLNGAQQAFVAVLLAQQSAQPLLLTADRGRGKSTALGEGLARLLEQGCSPLILSAPSRAAVTSVFAQLERVLPTACWQGDVLQLGAARLQWVPVQQLVEQLPPAGVLVIDEAASVGGAQLRRLVRHYPKMILSSTVQGYEGSGRGFLLRFKQWLLNTFPQACHLQLDQPVRWMRDDRLEQWLNNALLLQLHETALSQQSPISIKCVSQAALASDERLLQQVYGLLVSAHYQTRPSDLQYLLDAPGLHCAVAFSGEQVAGVLLAVEEGGFDAQLAQQVCAGKRRPRGHLLVQSLAQHAGLCDAPCLRLLRVMRIAVHPAMRRLGVGSQLLDHLQCIGRAKQFDLLGTSFGLQADLLPFWHRNGFVAARLGHKRDAASGTFSLQMLAPVSEEGRALQVRAHACFAAKDSEQGGRLQEILDGM